MTDRNAGLLDGRWVVTTRLIRRSKVEIREPDREFTNKIEGDKYEVWVPAKDIIRFNVSVAGTSKDGLRASRFLSQSELRGAMEQGVDLVFQKETKTVSFLVRHGDVKVAGAKLMPSTSGPSSSFQTAYKLTPTVRRLWD